MIEKLLDIIEKEDKKNPMKDDELAKIVGVSRTRISKLRAEHNIPTSSDRRKSLVIKEIEDINSGKNLSERKITDELNNRGYIISRSQVRALLKEDEDKKTDDDASSKLSKIKVIKQKDDGDGFENLIGKDGSLKEKITMLKSAMMYPPNGLHTIIYGDTGVGKSAIAECMYEFSIRKGYKKKNSPFIVFNCADYAENPSLLVAQLFGVEKGAYTGADSSKGGIVEKADGGILFLDEIHRLPSSGQEILFSLIDRGVYRRLGESSFERKANVLLICATTEDPESNLLKTFRRRIPMVINLPSLAERPVEERYDIILEFFKQESKRINKNFIIQKDVMKCLINYECRGNIGQLKSDIQVTCARAFSKSDANNDTVVVDLDSLRAYIKKDFDRFKDDRIEDIFIDISDLMGSVSSLSNNDISEIYQYAERELKLLERSNYTEDEIKNIFMKKIDEKFDEILTKKPITSRDKLYSFISEEMAPTMVSIMKKVADVVKGQYKHINAGLYPALAVHLEHTLKRIQMGKTIKNPGLVKIKNEMPMEFEMARYIAGITEDITDISLPEDELGYLAYYINKFCLNDDKVDENVKVVIATHGKVGVEMAKVVNTLMGVDCTIGIGMDLEHISSEGIKKCVDEIVNISAPRGMIILIDMGSLVLLGDEIEKRTNIKTKIISRVDTLLAMEVGKMAVIESKSLDEIYDYCMKDAMGCPASPSGTGINTSDDNKNKKQAVVTTCLSGKGNALKLKEILEKSLGGKSLNAQIIPVGIFDEIDVVDRLKEIENEYDIRCIVGTFDVKYRNVPFVDYSKIMLGQGIDDVIYYINDEKSQEHDGNIKDLSDIVFEDLIFENFEGISKEYVIDAMATKLEEGGYVDSRYILSVYKRESMGTLVLNQKVAIPHGLPENVIKPAVAIAKLTKPIIWDNEFMVDFVVMIAVKGSNQAQMRKMFSILGDDNKLASLTKA